MKFNVDECKVLHVGRNNIEFEYEMGGDWILNVDNEKDLGIIITKDLKPHEQCVAARNKANKILNMIRRQVECKSAEIVTKMYNSYVRPILENCIQFWCPYLVQNIDMLEKVQKRATKMIPGIRFLPYRERLARLKMFSLKCRRLRGI